MSQTVHWKRQLWQLLFVALVLRIVLAICVQFVVGRAPGRICLITGDAEGYWELAGKIADGQEYSIYDPPRRLLRMPGFPMLLSIPRLLAGDNTLVARFVLAVIGSLACGLTYWLGRELGGHAVGLVAGIYTTISPTLALFSVLFLSETAFATAMLASLIAASKLVRDQLRQNDQRFRGAKQFTLTRGFNSIQLSATDSAADSGADNAADNSVILSKPTIWQHVWTALVTGMLVGIATYIRPTWLLVGPGIALLIIVLGRDPLRSRVIIGACVCLGLAVALAPWTIRNAIVTGHFVPTTLWVGPSLYDGLNPAATGDSDMNFFEQDKLLSFMSEYEMDRTYRQRAWAYAAANPGHAVWLAIAKQRRFWSPIPNSAQFRAPGYRAVGYLVFVPLMTFAVVGAWFSRWNAWVLILTSASIFYFAGLHLLFVGSLRYRLPAEYPLSVLAAIGFCRLFRLSDQGAISNP